MTMLSTRRFLLTNVIFLLILTTCFTTNVDVLNIKRYSLSNCDWGGWSDFGPCEDGVMTRTRRCICDGESAPPNECPDDLPFSDTVGCNANNNNGNDNLAGDSISELEDESNASIANTTESVCGWKWSKWSPCTQPCGTNPAGNTSRTQICFCVGSPHPVEDETQCSLIIAKITETVLCNDFVCGDVRPRNKIYWINVAQSPSNRGTNGVGWPYPTNTTFPCSRDDSFQFSKKDWLSVLEDNIYVDNPAWHYLAKEYIPTRLNRAIGCTLSTDALLALEEGQYLLDKCGVYSTDEIRLAYINKEKLARFNNGIGGLSNVELQVGTESAGGGSSDGTNNAFARSATVGFDTMPNGLRSSQLTFILPLTVAIAVVVVLVVVVIAFLIIRRERIRQQFMILENETFLSSSEEEEVVKDDRSAEELRL